MIQARDIRYSFAGEVHPDDESGRAVYRRLEESAARTEATLVVVPHDRRLRDLIPNHLALTGGSGGESWEPDSAGSDSGRHAGLEVGGGRGR